MIKQKLLIITLSLGTCGCLGVSRAQHGTVSHILSSDKYASGMSPSVHHIPNPHPKRKKPILKKKLPTAVAQVGILPVPPQLQPGEIDIGAVAAVIKKSQTAPFTGVLLSPKATAQVIVEIQSQDASCQIEIKKQLDELKNKLNLKHEQLEISYNTFKESCEIKLKARDDAIDLLNKKLEKNTDPKTELWFIAGVTGGFVIGVGLTIATVFAVSETMK